MIARDKEMYVIGHYHVAPNHHVMIPPSWHNLRMQHGRGRWPKLFGGALRRASQRTRADRIFGICDPAATVDYDSFHGV
jgi:hypothetical protein